MRSGASGRVNRFTVATAPSKEPSSKEKGRPPQPASARSPWSPISSQYQVHRRGQVSTHGQRKFWRTPEARTRDARSLAEGSHHGNADRLALPRGSGERRLGKTTGRDLQPRICTLRGPLF